MKQAMNSIKNNWIKNKDKQSNRVEVRIVKELFAYLPVSFSLTLIMYVNNE